MGKVDDIAGAGVTHVWLPPPSHSVFPQDNCTTSSKVHSYEKLNFKRGKLNLISKLRIIAFFLLIGALLCSLTIRIIKEKVVAGLHPWNWVLLPIIIFVSHLISLCSVRFAVVCVEQKFLVHKRLIYWVYGVRFAVHNTIWIGLVLASWHFVQMVQQETGSPSPVPTFVNRVFLCLFCATLLILAKTTLLKAVATTFHVSSYFDQIGDALFTQSLIYTLSGPPLVDEDYMFEEFPTGHRIINLSRFSPTCGDTKYQSSDRGLKKISARNIKRFIQTVGQAMLLTPMHDKILQDGHESATEIAAKIFHNVARPGSKYIHLADLIRFIGREEATTRVINLFEGAKQQDRVSKRSLKNMVVNAFRERKVLMSTLNDTKTAVNKLNQIANIIVGVVVMVASYAILEKEIRRVLFVLITQLLLGTLVFGETLKKNFEGIVFLFVMHPFDVGDCCEIEGVQVVVHKINIMTSELVRYDHVLICYPNKVLATKPIMNYSRTTNFGDRIDFSVDDATPVDKMTRMKERILWYINNKKDHWYPGTMVVLRDVYYTNRLKVSIWLRQTLDFQDMGMMFARRELVLQEMIRVLKELEIEYQMLTPTT